MVVNTIASMTAAAPVRQRERNVRAAVFPGCTVIEAAGDTAGTVYTERTGDTADRSSSAVGMRIYNIA